MKKIKNTTLVILLTAYCVFGYSQNNTKIGLYKNENDFAMHKLTYELDCSSKQNLIKTNDFFESPKVVVKANDKKYIVLKKDFYGYHDCTGKDFRFYNNKLYEILDTASFYLYRHTALEPGNGGKGYATVTKYYFSKKGNSTMQLLSVNNLMNAFPQNVKFHYALETYVHNDNGLMDYDSYSKCYKLKYLFTESLK
jgi:hypothetical protein